MQLEQMMDLYQPRVSEQRRQIYFVVGDLESLSASALYTPKISVPRVGMNLPGGLTIKDITKNTITLQEDFGGVGNIYTIFYGLGEGKRNERHLEKVNFFGNVYNLPFFKMFFAERKETEFPEEIKVEMDRLESKDKDIYELNKKIKR